MRIRDNQKHIFKFSSFMANPMKGTPNMANNIRSLVFDREPERILFISLSSKAYHYNYIIKIFYFMIIK